VTLIVKETFKAVGLLPEVDAEIVAAPKGAKVPGPETDKALGAPAPSAVKLRLIAVDATAIAGAPSAHDNIQIRKTVATRTAGIAYPFSSLLADQD